MRTGHKKVFIDPSIAVASLNLSPESFNTPDGLETSDSFLKIYAFEI